MLRHDKIWLFALVFLLAVALPSRARPEEAPLLLGVAPFMTPAALFKRLTPLRIYLARELGREVVIELARDIPQLLDRIDQARYDLILGGAVFALRAFDGGHYVPGAIPGELTRALLLVRAGSAIRELAQLEGRLVATPNRQGPVGLIAPAFFHSHGLAADNPPRLQAFASHNAAFLAMQMGDVDAAFIPEFALRNFQSEENQVRVLARSEPFPGISLILARRLPAELRERIIGAVVGLAASPEGRALLQESAFPPFRRFQHQEFDRVRAYFAPVSSGQGP